MANTGKLDRNNVEDILALTPMQSGMLFHYLNEPGSSRYFEQLSLRLFGDIREEALREAWRYLADCNEMLRTVFRWENVEKPVQVVLKKMDIPITGIDFSSHSGDEMDRLLDEVRKKDRDRGFNIGENPFRVILCKISDEEFEMIISCHHIIYDGWSTGLILKELMQTYEQLYKGLQPAKQLKSKYKEFVKWHQTRDKSKEESFWKSYLDGFDTRTPVPLSSHVRGNTGRYDSHQIRISGEVVKGIEQLAKLTGITVSTIFNGVWGLILQKYNNIDDTVFGTTVSGRAPGVKGIEDIVGLFINTVPLRVLSKDNETVEMFLSRLHDEINERREFEYSTLVDVRAYSLMERREELFNSIVVFENYPLEDVIKEQKGILTIKGFTIHEETNFDLTVVINTLLEGIEVKFSYNTDVLQDEAVQQIAGCFINLVKQMAGNPQAKIQELCLLDEEEKKFIFEQFNCSEHTYPYEKSICRLFEEQVERTPDNIALIFEDRQVTYRQLNEMANRVAHGLLAQGLATNQIVGILVERSVEMIAGIYGILKAGAAYLPIDPGYPEERIQFLLGNSKTDLLLTQLKFRQRFENSGFNILPIEDMLENRGFSGENPLLDYRPEQLMYVLYTSGSTGNPKGVMVKSHAFVNLINWFTTEFGFGEKTRTLLIAPISFDLSQKNLYASLLKGGTLCLFTPGLYDYNLMSQTIEKYEIDNINCAPSAFYPLIDFNENTRFVRLRSLKQVFLGGEPINLNQLLSWVESQDYSGEIINTYGPTECTDISSFYRVDNREIRQLKSVPIGKPVHNARLFILDGGLNPVPVGAPGELCIGGAGLAEGYYNAPQLTHERFVEFPHLPGMRVYRTGDLVKWMPDGNIEFLGRLDYQVKIRGYRIELGEIENRLLDIQGVKEAVVIDRSDPGGNKYLCAYLTRETRLDMDAVKQLLSKELPQFMIPSYFVEMEKLPLTPNGKINRKSLPEPEGFIKVTQNPTASISGLGEELLGIWQKVLNKESIGITDNFFDIGGNSILLIQLHSAIEKRYPGIFTISDLFSYPTISKMAARLEESSKAYEETAAVNDGISSEKGANNEAEENHDIAIIGIGVKMPLADSKEEFWMNLVGGVDCVRPIPEARKKDIETALKFLDNGGEKRKYGELAYLDQIDAFDYGFFRISPKEASLMDPNQRMFLETAWNAIEDAGYGGKKLIGSRTGVYVGYGSDPDYKKLVGLLEPEEIASSLAGNIRPVIAGRLSYLQDFKGPNMIVDTTCSSSLVALHLACQAIRSHECDMAVIGGIQLHILPFRQTSIGVESSDGRAKTFDEATDGTGTGEGVVAICIKPLSKAVEDRDNIYAVIKGSAINHDGASNGLTAPNAVAQEDVIVRAWKDAGINPETIGYIEAHGTGTKLGDPIEINGMERAFSKFTNKKSFCAVGAVKTNIGHLDNAAGLAGLLKAVLTLRNRVIPPTLSFKRPNRKIDFVNSPVYVSDTPKRWDWEGPRRCGISAFGLSGTNCHIVLEEWDSRVEPMENEQETVFLLPLSAKTESGVKSLISGYLEFIKKNRTVSLGDLCYTASTGRGHYNNRLIVAFSNIEELADTLEKLEDCELSDIDMKNVFYWVHTLVPPGKLTLEEGEILETVQRQESMEFNRQMRIWIHNGRHDKEMIYKICNVYVRGAEIDWDEYYSEEKRMRISLPAYPFEKKRCWIDLSGKKPNKTRRKVEPLHELLDELTINLKDMEVWTTEFSPDTHWVLAEHRIGGECVLVGTTYLEMVIQVVKDYFKDSRFEFRDVVFLSPLSLGEDESRETQLVVRKKENAYEFSVLSKVTNQNGGSPAWIRHVEGKIQELPERKTIQRIDIGELKEKYRDGHMMPDIEEYNEKSVFYFGPRWKNISEMFIGDGELLSFIKMPEAFRKELKNYVLYPSLMDNALATMPLLEKVLGSSSFSGENGIFLPFSYKSFKLYGSLPSAFYSYVRMKTAVNNGTDIVSFDLLLASEEGEIIAEIEEYSLKRTKAVKGKENGSLSKKKMYYEVTWTQEQNANTVKPDGTVLVLRNSSPLTGRIVDKMRAEWGMRVIEVLIGDETAMTGPDLYSVVPDQKGFESLWNQLKNENFTRCIYMPAIGSCLQIDSKVLLDESQRMGVESLFNLAKGMLSQIRQKGLELVIVSELSDMVTAGEHDIAPQNATLSGLGMVIDSEYPDINVRFVDIDRDSDVDCITAELIRTEKNYRVALRNNSRYVEELREISLEDIEERELQIKEKGVYVITGGTGGIGLAMGSYLASRNKISLFLLNRTKFPEAEKWEGILQKNEDKLLCAKIKAVQEIERKGTQVFFLQADVSNEEELKRALESIRTGYGSINGIIHSSGTAGDGYIIKKSADECRRKMASKVEGTWLLHKLTLEDQLDFFLMFSSNNILMGIPGQGDYTAANTFLYSFAAYREKLGMRTSVICWPPWKETGMAANYNVNVDSIFKALPTKDALDIFDTVVNKKLNRVVIGEVNPGGVLLGKTIRDVRMAIPKDLLLSGKKRKDSEGPEKSSKSTALPNSAKLSGKTGMDFSDTEQKVAAIWKEVLGFEEFNVYDNFFEIGGDSIMITRVHNLLEKLYPGVVSVADLFNQTSIIKLSEYISSQVGLQSSGNIASGESKTDSNLMDDIWELVKEVQNGKLDADEALKSFQSLEV